MALYRGKWDSAVIADRFGSVWRQMTELGTSNLSHWVALPEPKHISCIYFYVMMEVIYGTRMGWEYFIGPRTLCLICYDTGYVGTYVSEECKASIFMVDRDSILLITSKYDSHWTHYSFTNIRNFRCSNNYRYNLKLLQIVMTKHQGCLS